MPDDTRRNADSTSRSLLRGVVQKYQENPYTMIRELGSAGSYGCVNEVKWTDDDGESPSTFACKTFYIEGQDPNKELQKEHKNILGLENISLNRRTHMVRLVEGFYVKPDTYCLVTEPVANELHLLHYLLESRSESDMKKLMGCLLVGLSILHDANIRHHDIHPRNILINNGVPIYTDFGLTRVFTDSDGSKTHGKAHHHVAYAAPEYHDSKLRSLFYPTARGRASDVFALGGVIFEMVAIVTGNQAMENTRPRYHWQRFGDKKTNEKAMEALNTLQRDDCCAKVIKSMLQYKAETRRNAIEAVYDLCGQDVLNGEWDAWMCQACADWCRPCIESELSREPHTEEWPYIEACN